MTHRYVRPATDLSCLREESGIGVDSSKLCLPPLWCDGYNLYDKNNGFVQKFPPLPVERRQLRKPKNRLKRRPKTWSKRLRIQMWIFLGLIRETKSFTFGSVSRPSAQYTGMVGCLCFLVGPRLLVALAPCDYSFASTLANFTERLWMTDHSSPVQLFALHTSKSANSIVFNRERLKLFLMRGRTSLIA